MKKIIWILLAFSVLSKAQDTSGGKLPSEVRWMYDDAKWGISHHYLAGGKLNEAYYDIRDYEQWNYFITNFDVVKYAQQAEKLGFGYVIFTLTQNRGYIATYSEVYDAHSPKLNSNLPQATTQKGKNKIDYTPTRDLIGDLAKELKKRGVKLIVYAPYHVGDRWTGKQIPTETPDWYKIDFLSELSKRWGDNVAGWWFDGYWEILDKESKSDYPISNRILKSIRTGNPNAILSFNAGIGGNIYLPSDKNSHFTPGEANEFPKLPVSRAIKGPAGNYAQHVGWSFLSKSHPLFAGWGQVTRNLKYEDRVVASRTLEVYERGGVSSWDVAINSNGTWPLEKIRQVQVIGNVMGTSDDKTYSNLRFVNNDDQKLIYTGNWKLLKETQTGAFNQDLHITENNGDAVHYTFYGSSLVLATSKTPDSGSIEIFIDGESQGVISLYEKYKTQVQVVVFETHNLAEKIHELKVVKKSGEKVSFDMIGVKK